MKDASFHILRVGTAITFLWIAVLIFKNPAEWGSFLQPWAADLLPVPLEQAMIGTAILDFLIGFFLLVDMLVLVSSLLGATHLLIVLITVGIDAVTVRDIGLLATTIALAFSAYPLHGKPSNLKELLKIILR